ncbi:MAG: NAD(P)-dependent oxidoreductase [Desulfomonile sp.]
MRFLVTGATGFIGSHVAELLIARGFDVVCPVRNPGSLRHLQEVPVTVVSNNSLGSVIADGPSFDYVIHLAAATRGLNYHDYETANVDWTLRLLELFDRKAAADSLKRFVFVSSQAAAGPSPDDAKSVVETDPPRPLSLYGISKLEAEKVVMSLSKTLPITIVRPPTVFGPRDIDVLGVFKCARWRFVPCMAGPDRLVSIVYVEDLADGILAAALSPVSQGKIYFIANPDPVVWKEFALLVSKVMGYRAVPLPVPLHIMKLVAKAGDLLGKVRGSPTLFRTEKFHEMKQIAWVCSVDRARTDLQWMARTPITEAIAKTAKWYREHGWL